MSLYSHHVVAFGPGRRDAVHAHIAANGVPAVVARGGRLFAHFKPLIGLSLNHAIVITEWEDDADAKLYGSDILNGLEKISVLQHDLWQSTLRPAPGDQLPHADGLYSHRWFDVRDEDVGRFLELSGGAWDNFEDAHGSRVVGLWRSLSPPSTGVTRLRLTAWYADMGVWERSRWFNRPAGAEAANTRFAERAALTLDSAVSIVQHAG